jgi:hypothetical protein
MKALLVLRHAKSSWSDLTSSTRGTLVGHWRPKELS